MHISHPTPPDFSFQETLAAHGWRRLLPFLWHEETKILERYEEVPDGSVAMLRLSSLDGTVSVEVDRDTEEADLTRRVRRMLQLDIPLEEFHAYCGTHAELATIAHRRQGRMLRCPTLWEDVVKVIATTNTTWAQTIAMTTRLVTCFGAEGRAFPRPEQVATVPFEEFAAQAKMGYRNASVYKLATAIVEGSLDLEAWQEESLTASELRKRLLTLPGVGPYAAACLMLYLGKPEHVNADSWARTLVAKEIGRSATDKDVHDFFAVHGPWRGLVYSFYPWRNES